MSEAENKTGVFTTAEIGEPVAESDVGNTNKRRRVFEQYVQPSVAELFGTALFVFMGCASVIGNAESTGVIQPAVAHGFVLGVMIMVFGPISGGHFNPAVSLTAYLCGAMELLLLVPYILAQMLGALVGAGLTKAVFPSIMYDASLGAAFNVTTNNLAAITLAEVIMTTFLTLVVALGAFNSQTSSPLTPFCIALTVTANIFAGAMISGSCTNPARAFGPAAIANHWKHHWIFWVGPICGAVITVSLIRFLFGDSKKRIVLK